MNDGYTYIEIANELGTTYGAISCAIATKVLIKPKNYKIKYKKIVCLDLNDKQIQIYDSINSAVRDLGKSNGVNISSCLSKKSRSDINKIRKTAYGYKWMYLEDYENMIKNKNGVPP